jgi:hypothetical protein
MATRQTSKPKIRFSWKLFGSTKKTCNPKNDVLDEGELVSTLSRWRRRMKKVRLTLPPPTTIAYHVQFLRKKPSKGQQREPITRELMIREPIISYLARQVQIWRRPRIQQRKQDVLLINGESYTILVSRVTLRWTFTEFFVITALQEFKFFFQLDREIRDRIYDLLVDDDQFKAPLHPPYSHPPYCLPIPQLSCISYVQKITPVNRQFYNEFIAAVCRNPSCRATVTIRDTSVARHHRSRFQQLLRLGPHLFYPGDPVTAQVLMWLIPQPYLGHIRDLRLFCVIDRSDMGTNVYKLRRTRLMDTAPSIEGALAIRSMLPSLQNLELWVYVTVRDVYGANYSLLWIDDRIEPLIVLPPSTKVRVMVPVSDSDNVDNPDRRYMLIWHAHPGGPDARDWLHSHGNGKPDLDGAEYCYRCLREHQDLHRFKRIEYGCTSRPAESTFFETLHIRTTNEATGAETITVERHFVPPPN